MGLCSGFGGACPGEQGCSQLPLPPPPPSCFALRRLDIFVAFLGCSFVRPCQELQKHLWDAPDSALATWLAQGGPVCLPRGSPRVAHVELGFVRPPDTLPTACSRSPKPQTQNPHWCSLKVEGADGARLDVASEIGSSVLPLMRPLSLYFSFFCCLQRCAVDS